MMRKELYGEFQEQSTTPPGEYLDLAFSPLSAPLRSRWRNNGLSADFLGDYVTTFLPTDPCLAADDAWQNEIRHAVTYIANELLENAMKYHQHDESMAIAIHLELSRNQITVSARNGITSQQASRYKEFIAYLLRGNPVDLVLQQLEEGAKRADAPSGLGLLTMVSDYAAELGWCFETHTDDCEAITVTTNANFALKSLPEVSQ